MKAIWNKTILSIDGDTFTVGECVKTCVGTIALLVVIGLAA